MLKSKRGRNDQAMRDPGPLQGRDPATIDGAFDVREEETSRLVIAPSVLIRSFSRSSDSTEMRKSGSSLRTSPPGL